MLPPTNKLVVGKIRKNMMRIMSIMKMIINEDEDMIMKMMKMITRMVRMMTMMMTTNYMVFRNSPENHGAG